MKRMVRAVVVLVAMALASSARGQVAFDLKAGYSLPMGNAWGTSPWNPARSMTDVWTGAVPLELAARYRFNPNVSAGVYFQYGPAFLKSPGPDGIDGTWGADVRVGLELVYAFLPDGTANPWFGIGTGWEWTSYSGQKSGAASAVTLNGWEYLNVQAGLDVNVSRAFAVGPYVGFLGGTYSSIGTSGASVGFGGAIEPAARAFHAWLQLGLKATVNL